MADETKNQDKAPAKGSDAAPQAPAAPQGNDGAKSADTAPQNPDDGAKGSDDANGNDAAPQDATTQEAADAKPIKELKAAGNNPVPFGAGVSADMLDRITQPER